MNTNEALALAQQYIALARQIEATVAKFDTSFTMCKCCTARRFNNWPQQGLAKKVKGVAERLYELAENIDRRATDKEFLTGQAS